MRALLLVTTLVGILFGYWVLSTLVFTHIRYHRYHHRAGLEYPPLGVSGWAIFYARTLASALRLWWWWWRASLANGLRIPARAQQGPPVLCVHGFHMNGTCMWGLRRTLERHGRATQAVTLGLPYRSPEVYARALARALRSLLAQAPGTTVDLVAHSMGGLVLRMVLAKEPELAAGVRRIVTLGTPHAGTAILRWIRFGPTYRMMSRGSPFLRSLPTFVESAPRAITTTVASYHDLIVYPVETAHLEGARQVTLSGLGHIGLLTDRSVSLQVARLLEV